MPVTPFHVGPGLLLKGLAPRHVSLSAFVLANVVIDAEVGVRVLLGEPWLHAHLHTLWGALLAGALAGIAVAAFGRWRENRTTETARGPALVGGLLGGVGQTGLDAIMHADLLPLWPFFESNPALGIVGVGALHLGCVVAGVVGLGLWAARSRGSRSEGPRRQRGPQ